MIDPDPEKVKKRYRSFLALYDQIGNHWEFIKSVAESYEWACADRDFWKNESIELRRELKKCQTSNK